MMYMRWVVSFFVFCLIFLLLLHHPVSDPDFGWHLRNGERIIQERVFPFEDRYSWTMPGFLWADSYWFFEVLLYLASKTLGLLIFALILTLLASLTLISLGKSSPFLSFLGTIMTIGIVGNRAQTISFILFSLLWLSLRSLSIIHYPLSIILYPLLFLLWSNTHAGFVLGLALLWSFWLIEAGRVVYKKIFNGQGWWVKAPLLSPPILKKLFTVNLVSTFVTLINPYNLSLWRTIVNDATSPLIKENIIEWLAPSFRTEIGVMLLFYVLFIFVVVALKWPRSSPCELLLLLLFGLNAFSAIRNLPFLVAIATPFLASNLSQVKLPRTIFGEKLWQFFFWLMMFLVSLRAGWNKISSFGNPETVLEEIKHPYKAVSFLKNHPQEGKIFNSYGWGGFLIWQLPETETFIDGRMCGWKTKEKNIFVDYIDIEKLNPGFEEKINSWGIDWFLIRTGSPLAAWLQVNPIWQKIYEEKNAVIFTKSEKVER
jgi:hypothetical protein